jgi:hypothetical protein
MADPHDLLVVSIPGLAGWMLQTHAPALLGFAERARRASLVVPAGCEPAQLEAALESGMFPPHTGAPFWELAGRVAGAGACRVHRISHIAQADHAGLAGAIAAADAEFASFEASHRDNTALVVISAWARTPAGLPATQDAPPDERPVLLSRNLEQPKTCMGLLEVAGLLRRALTGQRVQDACPTP